ncbi:MAG: hypothetical protein LAO79_11050 [Acidobacteriia bacterium]|nr:hypothetical protein [Terriglobia bacterium]
MKLLAALFVLSFAARAAELELRYSTLERIVAEQLFTQEGRHYVRGNKSTHCQFAYLEKPQIDADGPRLRVKARFSGRSALDLLGGCVGLGDSFDLTLTASPAAKNGAIVFNEVNVATPKDSYYIRRVRLAMARSIARDFKIEVRDQARALLASSGDLTSFDLSEVRVTPVALILVIDFKLVVK